jgi:hypothetical protein
MHCVAHPTGRSCAALFFPFAVAMLEPNLEPGNYESCGGGLGGAKHKEITHATWLE